MSSSKDSKNKSESVKWVVVQLTSFAERERNVEAITRAAKRILGDKIELLIPAVKEKAREEELTTFYMDGYIFIKYEESINFMKLSDTPFFKNVLYNARSKTGNPYQLLDDAILNPMRTGMKELTKSAFKVNDSVRVIKGTYKNLDGVVVSVFQDKDQIQIRVPLRSKPLLINFPASFLKKDGK